MLREQKFGAKREVDTKKIEVETTTKDDEIFKRIAKCPVSCQNYDRLNDDIIFCVMIIFVLSLN